MRKFQTIQDCEKIVAMISLTGFYDIRHSPSTVWILDQVELRQLRHTYDFPSRESICDLATIEWKKESCLWITGSNNRKSLFLDRVINQYSEDLLRDYWIKLNYPNQLLSEEWNTNTQVIRRILKDHLSKIEPH